MIDRSPLRLLLAVQGASRGLQRVKLEGLIEAIRTIYPTMQVADSELRGLWRLWGLVTTFSPRLNIWREKFYADPRNFRLRSTSFCREMERHGGGPDAVLQVGVLFDASSACTDATPVVIYTDYVVTMTAKSGRAFRMPLSDAQIVERIEQERRAFERAAFVLTRSKAVADAVISDYGIAPRKVMAVGGGANIKPPTQPRRGISAQVGPQFLFIGRDFYRKGGDMVVEAFAQVIQAFPGARLVMITQGHPNTAPKGITWVDEISGETLAGAYRGADAFIIASRFETWGDVVIEAMTAGLACICPDASPFDEIVIDGETGLLVAGPTASGLAGAMKEFAANPDLCRQMGESGQRRAAAQFTWNITAERIALKIDAAVAATTER
jgi:alpha-maltose-1-phosphate synthase